MTWLRAKCLFKGETLMKAKHHLFLISYQNGIWFFSKHSTSTAFFLYPLSSSNKVSLSLSRNLVTWKLFCRKQAEQLCKAAADGGPHHHLPEGLNSSGWARHKNCNKRHSSYLTENFPSSHPWPSLWQLYVRWGQAAKRPLPIRRRGLPGSHIPAGWMLYQYIQSQGP